jgi:pimeloyl-ACP methyl ester carboxylesterase
MRRFRRRTALLRRPGGNDHFGFREPAVPIPELNVRVDTVHPRGFDPRATLGTIRVPTLWIYGELDTSTPAAKSIRVLDSLSASGVPGIQHRPFSEANHIGMIVRGPNRALMPDFAPGLWDTASNWITRVAPAR